jgi:hypothetical protein
MTAESETAEDNIWNPRANWGLENNIKNISAGNLIFGSWQSIHQ